MTEKRKDEVRNSYLAHKLIRLGVFFLTQRMDLIEIELCLKKVEYYRKVLEERRDKYLEGKTK